MSTTPRYPERLDIDISPAGSVGIVNGDDCDTMVVDMSARVSTDNPDECDVVEELVRRYNLHGKLVDFLKFLALTADMSTGACADIAALLKEAEASE